MGTRQARSWLTRIGTVAVIGALALGAGNPALARAPKRPAIGDVSVFASAPAPGHPFGIAVDEDGRVYVSTSAGDFFAGHQNSDDERVFTYDAGGRLIDTTVIDTARELGHGPVRPGPRRQQGQAPQALRRGHERPDPSPRAGRAPGRAGGLLAGARLDRPRRRLDALDVERPRLRQDRQPVRPGRQAADLAGRSGRHGQRSGSRTRASPATSGSPEARSAAGSTRPAPGCTSRSPSRPSSRSSRPSIASGWSTIRPLRTSSSSTGSRSIRPRPLRRRRPAWPSPSPATSTSA